jgi:hypothetical protein
MPPPRQPAFTGVWKAKPKGIGFLGWPYRQIAAVTDVALGTVDWIFKDLKEMGFLVEIGGRKRKITNPLHLLKRWVEAYPEQLRPKLGLARFKADDPDWWKDVDIIGYNACWGGEVAAAKLTGQLKPEGRQAGRLSLSK